MYCITCPHLTDHCQSLDYINQYIPVYANEGVFDKFDNALKGSIIEQYQVFGIGSIKCMPIFVEHGSAKNTAIVFKDKDNMIFFGTDFSNMSDNLINFPFDEIWIECNYYEKILNEIKDKLENEKEYALKYTRQITTHMSLKNCVYHLKNKFNLSKCKKIVLLHLSTECGDAKIMKEKVEKETNINTYIALRNGGVE